MFVGKKYKLLPDTRGYPRYKFYRQRLKEVFTRADNTLVKNSLQDFVSQGRQTWSYIQDTVRECISQTANVSLYVFAASEAHLKNIKEDLIRDKSIINGRNKLPPELIEKTPVQWESFVRRMGSEFAPEVIIYVKGEKENERTIEAQMRALNQIQQDRLVIYDIKTKTSFLYKAHKEENDEKILSHNVEFILERNAVLLLEYVDDFISKFVPGRVDQELSSSSIKEKIITQLQESLGKEHVLKDFLPVETDDEQYSEALKTEKLTMLTKEKKEENIFHIKVRSFISRKTKCEFCDLTSKRVGVPGNFMNEFLSEEFFNFEKKMQEKLTSNILPRWPVRYDLETMFRSTAYFCRTICGELFPEAEKYIKRMYSVLKSFKKDQFEIHGLLRQAPRAASYKVPKTSRIARHLQNDLLAVNNVEACGNLYGTLTVIVNKSSTAEQRSEIEAIIKKNKHTFPFEIAVTDRWKENAPNIESGGGIFCEFNEGGRERLSAKLDTYLAPSHKAKGTLGCFVESESGSDLFGVTCYHCVSPEYFTDEVKAAIGDTENTLNLGTRSHGLYHEYTLDIALIKVNEHVRRYCDKQIGLSKDDAFEKARHYKFKTDKDDLDGLTVYKNGQSSRTTLGMVVGSDFKTKHMNDLQKRGFTDHYNIFIAARAGDDRDFSYGGDSGSVVCLEDISSPDESPSVEVISLLCGTITLDDHEEQEASQSEPTRSTYSYSCHLKTLLDELSSQVAECPRLKEAIE